MYFVSVTKVSRDEGLYYPIPVSLKPLFYGKSITYGLKHRKWSSTQEITRQIKKFLEKGRGYYSWELRKRGMKN